MPQKVTDISPYDLSSLSILGAEAEQAINETIPGASAQRTPLEKFKDWGDVSSELKEWAVALMRQSFPEELSLWQMRLAKMERSEYLPYLAIFSFSFESPYVKPKDLTEWIEQNWDFVGKVIDQYGYWEDGLGPTLVEALKLSYLRWTPDLAGFHLRLAEAAECFLHRIRYIDLEVARAHPDRLVELAKLSPSYADQIFQIASKDFLTSKPDTIQVAIKNRDRGLIEDAASHSEVEDRCLVELSNRYGLAAMAVERACRREEDGAESRYRETLEQIVDVAQEGAKLIIDNLQFEDITGAMSEQITQWKHGYYQSIPAIRELSRSPDLERIGALNREIFGTYHIRRYPDALLRQNVENLDPTIRSDLPLACFFVARSDHNGAYNNVGHEINQISQHFKCFVFEVSSTDEILDGLRLVRESHREQDGSSRKIDIAAIHAHGWPEGLVLFDLPRHTLMELGQFKQSGAVCLSVDRRDILREIGAEISSGGSFLISACAVAAGGVSADNLFSACIDEMPHLRIDAARQISSFSGYKYDPISGILSMRGPSSRLIHRAGLRSQ